jgi:hypothetical protein
MTSITRRLPLIEVYKGAVIENCSKSESNFSRYPKVESSIRMYCPKTLAELIRSLWEQMFFATRMSIWDDIIPYLSM